ncbi:type II toxin-antitoxin system HicA family toxin [Desulfobacula sp.]|uniref:type II toxin-antitoxin system HicA family toxin n=1 Tax=Desulfobacula sp. TaxID=2593537 RepID=UPI0025C5B218|nr:type II toxin-antitoxin system HicA family toxin [Desulfobacula sp.]
MHPLKRLKAGCTARCTLPKWRLRLVKLKILSGKEVCNILSNHGFMEIRRKGSHVIMQKKIPGSTVTVPVPDHKEIKIGTLQSVIRQAGLSRKEFE